jgi:hypothetical protein
LSKILRNSFFASFSSCRVIANFTIFYEIKVRKHIQDPCCHLTAETGS